MSAVAGLGTGAASTTEPGQIASATELAKTPHYGSVADPHLCSPATSFQKNWESQFARLGTGAASPVDQKARPAGLGDMQPGRLNDSADRRDKPSLVLRSQVIGTDFAAKVKIQQRSENPGNLEGVGASERTEEFGQTPGASNHARAESKTSRESNSISQRSKSSVSERAVEPSQASLQIVSPFAADSSDANPIQAWSQKDGSDSFALDVSSIDEHDDFPHFPTISPLLASAAQVSFVGQPAGISSSMKFTQYDRSIALDSASTRDARSIEIGAKILPAHGSHQEVPGNLVAPGTDSAVAEDTSSSSPSSDTHLTMKPEPPPAFDRFADPIASTTNVEIRSAGGQARLRESEPILSGPDPNNNVVLQSRADIRTTLKAKSSPSSIRPPIQDTRSATTHSSTAQAIGGAVHPLNGRSYIALPGQPGPLNEWTEVTGTAYSGLSTSNDLRLPGSEHATTETFHSLDSAASTPNANWGSLNPRRAEAGFQDPSLGWVDIRAEVGGGGVHAIVTGSSPEAAQALGGHIPGLSAYLTENRTPVETLTLATSDGNAQAGFGTNDQRGHREDGQHESSKSNPSSSAAERPAPSDSFGVTSATSKTDHPMMNWARGGTYVSVIA